ncbi:integumentary mucin C.1-like [Cyprinodon tularosa]|uniref:integumentary mucin C.1-like n=1 Tax=Cyprinodon tularosa TaxID=77115 RepID=UPI0018E1FB0E|nr:integumentary mucin C.1-like [Cyprinodon tularosa]
MCNSSNSCSNTSSSTCTCINGLPPNDEFCQPETNNSICPTPTPVTTTTAAPTTKTATAVPTTTMATPTTTTLSPTTTPVFTTTTTAAPTTTTTAPTITTASTTITFPQQRGVTFVLKIPAYFIQNYTLQIFRSRLDEVFNSLTLPPSLKVKEINLTTVCFKGISKELRCQCEDNFAWPCERCNSSRYSCSNVSSDYCTCRDGISSINEYCQPLLNNSRCPATPTTPLPTTTTAEPTTTSAMPNTTTAKPTTTSAMPVISTALPTTARPIPPIPPTAEPQVIRGRITIDIPFEPSFNTESSPFYQGIYDTITSQCGECSATLRLSPGSTIADYNITFTPPDTLTEEQILRQMSLKYPVLINGENKEQRAYSGDPLTLTCEPPSIDFSAVTVFWRNKGKVIAEQSTLTNGKSEYKFPRIFKFDEGEYECEIKWGSGSRFIQKVTLKSITLPDIDADPDRERLRCIDTKQLSCRVNDGFTVKLLDSEDQGKCFIK